MNFLVDHKLGNKTMASRTLNTIYKILTRPEFRVFITKGIFDGNSMDKKDGYIHMSSNATQYERVRKKYYSAEEKVCLLNIDASTLDNLKYEPISSGDIYPHQYGILKLSNVIKVDEI